jgi:glycosyltransferase involved in cell wall biosynthesis
VAAGDLDQTAVRRRVLLSAYACEPGKGSEPGLGWNWAVALPRLGYDVTVLTRANNRAVLEPAIATLRPEDRPTLAAFDLPDRLAWWKRGQRGVRLYFLLWQWGAYDLARRLHAERPFDLVHHVTFAGVRQPSFLGRLGVPFVFGPVAGGERTPPSLLAGLGFRGRVAEAARGLGGRLVRVDPLMARTFASAARVYVTSPETLALLPSRAQGKARVRLAIGLGENDRPPPAPEPREGPLRLLFAGRLVAWKGLHLALAALARHGRGTLTVVGDGPMAEPWRRLAARLGVGDRVMWAGSRSRAELFGRYAEHDALLFPSLHDSGGMVVLEALAAGLPVVCLDLGGPGAIVSGTCGRVVATGGRDEAAVVAGLAAALDELADPRLRRGLAAGARARAEAFAFEARARALYTELATDLKGSLGPPC